MNINLDDSPSVSSRLASLPEDVQALFSNAENGTPDNISKAGCLALAKLGKDAWNAWRDAFPVKSNFDGPPNRVDFSGQIFADGFNFSGFKFGAGANFSCTRFRSDKPDTVIFFSGAKFGCRTSFDYACFESSVTPCFASTKWGREIYFRHCYIANRQGGDFTKSTWCGSVYFYGAKLSSSNFFESKFYQDASFEGVQLGEDVNFSQVTFRKEVTFEGRNWDVLVSSRKKERGCSLGEEWTERNEVLPDAFGALNFSGAVFKRKANFSHRKFLGRTNFDRTKFTDPPIFHGCELHQDTTFDGAEFPSPTGKHEALRAYRALKFAFNKQQAVREEQRFFRLEMAEEARQEQGFRRALFWAYETFSDYGFSFLRPLGIALGFSLVMAFVYGCLSLVGNCLLANVRTCDFSPQWLTFSVLQTLPMLGMDKFAGDVSKAFWPEGDWWDLILVVLLTIHKTVIFTAIFLVGLAMRNLFKLK